MSEKDTNPALPEPPFSGPYCCFCGASREPLDGSPGRHSAFCDTRTARHLAQPSPSPSPKTITVEPYELGYRVTLPNIWAGTIGFNEQEARDLHASLGAAMRMGQGKCESCEDAPRSTWCDSCVISTYQAGCGCSKCVTRDPELPCEQASLHAVRVAAADYCIFGGMAHYNDLRAALGMPPKTSGPTRPAEEDTSMRATGEKPALEEEDRGAPRGPGSRPNEHHHEVGEGARPGPSAPTDGAPTANPTVQRVQRTWQRWAAGEMDRMREALQAIHAWDMLNPADASVLADAPWLKKIVVDALTLAPGDEREPPLVDAQPIAQDAYPYPATVEFLGPRSPQNAVTFRRLHTLMLRVYVAGIEEQKRQAAHAALCASFPEHQPVTINMKLEARNYTDEGREKRRPGAKGKATGKFSDSHGLCFEIEHEDGTKAWYDLDELRKG